MTINIFVFFCAWSLLCGDIITNDNICSIFTRVNLHLPSQMICPLWCIQNTVYSPCECIYTYKYKYSHLLHLLGFCLLLRLIVCFLNLPPVCHLYSHSLLWLPSSLMRIAIILHICQFDGSIRCVVALFTLIWLFPVLIITLNVLFLFISNQRKTSCSFTEELCDWFLNTRVFFVLLVL